MINSYIIAMVFKWNCDKLHHIIEIPQQVHIAPHPWLFLFLFTAEDMFSATVV